MPQKCLQNNSISIRRLSYRNEEEAKKQLPRYMILRTMPKEERKKLINEEKAARLKAKQAAAAKSKGKTNRGK